MSAQRIPFQSAFQSSGAPSEPWNIASCRGPRCSRGTMIDPGWGR